MAERPSRTHRDPPHVIAKILRDLDERTSCPTNPSKAFICRHDLKQIWQNKDRIRVLLEPDRISSDIVRLIQEDFYVILSVLVTIWASSCLSEFRRRFRLSSGSSNPPLTDRNLPLSLSQIKTFLGSELPLVQQFFEIQYKFCPQVISCDRAHKLLVIDPNCRLPIQETTELGAGSFGQVTKVKIAPRYFKESSGAEYDRPHVVACKSFRVREEDVDDLQTEVDNLQILKESLTKQDRILQHYATIIHGRDRYILFPYAEYGDLFQFLHNGMSVDGRKRYQFNEWFPDISISQDLVVYQNLLRQCWALTNALSWLHNGIAIESTTNKVFCAHMDLKPDNILIMPDDAPDHSIVGKWTISDFGISVVQQDISRTGQIISVRDWYNGLTLNTHARRLAGTYQAPEILHSEISPQEQKGVGRKSDIWSYGCIFSEVLAWALGREQAVDKFSDLRDTSVDLFFEDTNQLLQPYSGPFKVRDSIVNWLNAIEEDKKMNLVARCWAATVKKILVIKSATRPDAAALEKLVQHVNEHCKDFSKAPTPGCPLFPHSEERRPTTPDDTHPRPSPIPPIIFDHVSDEGTSSGAPSLPRDVITPDSRSFDTGLTSAPSRNTFSVTDSDLPQERHDALLFIRPSHAEGVVLGSRFRRSSDGSKCQSVFKNHKFVMSLSQSKVRGNPLAAYFGKDKISVFRLNLGECTCESEAEINILGSHLWENPGVAIEGQYLAAWGYSRIQERKLLYMGILDNNPQEHFVNPVDENVEMLSSVAVSAQGVVALVRSSSVLIRHITAEPNTITALSSHAPFRQAFTHATFNENGSLLFAYASGSKQESIYAWRIVDGPMQSQPSFTTHYPLQGKEPLSISSILIPYNTYPGCILAVPDQQEYTATCLQAVSASSFNDPAQTSNTREGHNDYLQYVSTGCVFQDHSFVALRKKPSFSGLRKRNKHLVEYRIRYGESLAQNHSLDLHEEILCELKSDCRSSSLVRCFKNDGDENVTAVVCNKDGSVEFVRFAAQAPGSRG